MFILGQAVKDLVVVHLAGEASKLVVFADSEIRAVPLHHCDSPAAATCKSCVALQDPHCAWDATANLCVAVSTKLHDSDADKTLFQDISTGRHRNCGYEQGMAIDISNNVYSSQGTCYFCKCIHWKCAMIPNKHQLHWENDWSNWIFVWIWANKFVSWLDKIS